MPTATSTEPRLPRLTGALLRAQPDRRLADLAAEGSRPAFEELVRRHRAKLVAFAAGIAPPSAADDVVQDAMLRAYLALARGDRPELPKAWLYKIVRNTALNHRRGWRPHDELDDPAAAGETIDGVEQPPDAAERKRRFGALVVALGDLPHSQRNAIVQRELEGRGHDEIATAMGVSPGAVRQLIHRARTTLRASAGALVPVGLLRLLALPGAVEPVSSGAGITAAKLGAAAALATGAVMGGGDVADRIKSATGPPEAAIASAPAPAAPGAAKGFNEAGEGDRARSDDNARRPASSERGERDSGSAGAPPPPHHRESHHPHEGRYGDPHRQGGTRPSGERDRAGGDDHTTVAEPATQGPGPVEHTDQQPTGGDGGSTAPAPGP